MHAIRAIINLGAKYMANGKKIIIADDDKTLVSMYRDRLEHEGYVVFDCANGEELLKQVGAIKPDLIMLDLIMPRLNGYDTLLSLKSDPVTKDIPLVILTTLINDFNRGKAIDAGATEYLIKSEVTPKEVIATIRDILAKSEAS